MVAQDYEHSDFSNYTTEKITQRNDAIFTIGCVAVAREPGLQPYNVERLAVELDVAVVKLILPRLHRIRVEYRHPTTIVHKSQLTQLFTNFVNCDL